MKKLLIICSVLFALPAGAFPVFKYQTPCHLERKELNQYLKDVCTVVETREKGGALRTRNIYSNKFGLTIKGRFVQGKGYMTWDSHNKYEYKWDYIIGRVAGDTQPHTYVMPGVLLENISWD